MDNVQWLSHEKWERMFGWSSSFAKKKGGPQRTLP